MRFTLALLLMVAGCENPSPIENVRPSVRWVQSSHAIEPLCLDARVTTEPERILCEWDCHRWWTSSEGVGDYYVSRGWYRRSDQWVPAHFLGYPENATDTHGECFDR